MTLPALLSNDGFVLCSERRQLTTGHCDLHQEGVIQVGSKIKRRVQLRTQSNLFFRIFGAPDLPKTRFLLEQEQISSRRGERGTYLHR